MKTNNDKYNIISYISYNDIFINLFHFHFTRHIYRENTMPDTAKIMDATVTVLKSTPTARSKSKCGNDGCGHKPAPIVGDCAYCESRFCAQHRLPEMHECPKMKQCRQIAKTENTQRLNSQALSSVMNVGY